MLADEELHRHAAGRLERGARPRRSGGAVQQLKLESGKGLLLGGVKLPLALAELGLIDEYEFLERREFGSGVVTMRYGPRR